MDRDDKIAQILSALVHDKLFDSITILAWNGCIMNQNGKSYHFQSVYDYIHDELEDTNEIIQDNIDVAKHVALELARNGNTPIPIAMKRKFDDYKAAGNRQKFLEQLEETILKRLNSVETVWVVDEYQCYLAVLEWAPKFEYYLNEGLSELSYIEGTTPVIRFQLMCEMPKDLIPSRERGHTDYRRNIMLTHSSYPKHGTTLSELVWRKNPDGLGYISDPTYGEVFLLNESDMVRAIADYHHLSFYLCKDCQSIYSLGSNEIEWYTDRDMTPPKRCPTCREKRKKAKEASA